MRLSLLLPLFLLASAASGQQKPASNAHSPEGKPPLDPSVYDGWQNIGERLLSPDGKYLVYTVTPQEGDGTLFIRSTTGFADYAKEIPRGSGASITGDSRFLVFHIKPFFKDTREARIKKKTPDQTPKDSLAWIELGTDSVTKIPRVRSFKIPEDQGRDWLAYLLEKPLPPSAKIGEKQDSLTRLRLLMAHADSLSHLADSLRKLAAEISAKGWPAPPSAKKVHTPETFEEGTDLIFLHLPTGEQKKFPLTTQYYLSKKGNTLVVETSRKKTDTTLKSLVLWVNTGTGHVDTVLAGFEDTRNYTLDDQGTQLAFVADRDSAAKALSKFYRLFYYTPGMDSAVVRADRNSIASTLASDPRHLSFPLIPSFVSNSAVHQPPPSPGRLTVSPDFANFFSKDGSRLFFGLAPVRPPKDTTLVDFETARLDVWNYNDDYLSPEQLVRNAEELKRSYLAVLPKDDTKFLPLADENCETIRPPLHGNGPYALGMSSKGYRIQQQWEQDGLENIYLVDLSTGSRQLIREKVRGGATLSPGGKFILWYEWKEKHWYTYDIAAAKINKITGSIHAPLFDEEDDHPDDPPPHGAMGWQQYDRYVYIYDKYDIWQCDPKGNSPAINLTRGIGRRHQLTFRYIGLDREEPAICDSQWVLLTLFNQKDKSAGLKLYHIGKPFSFDTTAQFTYPQSYSGFLKAKKSWTLAYLEGSFDRSNDIYVTDFYRGIVSQIDSTSPTTSAMTIGNTHTSTRFSHLNPQQASYNWLTVELHHWKMFDGKMSEGLLYKPENFDSTKHYPIIFYFYERDADNRYSYEAPSPDRAIINISYFVSNGYLVFDPNIYYKTGQPGEDAYNSVISAARYMSRFKWVDTTKMGLEGHSWGGYQVAYLVTRTHMFTAAEAGAPVANMTSAYGGIRWGAGISRQFQYEKSQSRIGYTLWQRPDLYIKNSPLFRADKITTPLLMMHNDADGAVPWYQGIEYFSALRRLGKKAWLIQYNGEDHGLQERRNRKDWSLRMSQFFDYYLKDQPPARWITDGVPSTLKGIDWGLESPSNP
jgi:dienelactone hydrolase